MTQSRTPDFQCSTPMVDQAEALSVAMSRTPPPNYVVLRAGSQTPERFVASSDEHAREMLQKQVRQGQTPIVYLFKLMSAEVFLPSSETLTVDQISARLVGRD